MPNFGADQDIVDSKHSLAITEDALKHKIIMGTAESRKRWHNVAKDTLYDFQPRYDQDIQASLKNLGDAEAKLEHKWNIEAWLKSKNVKVNWYQQNSYNI